MKEDQTIDRIREARRRISAACDHDPHKLVNYYKELQKKHKERLIQSEGSQGATADDLVKA